MDEKGSPEWLRNLPIRSEEIGYSPDEMLRCDACAKPNAPNRSACLYCGAALAGARPQLEIRELESWENGYNVVLIDVARSDVDAATNKLSTTLGADPVTIRQLLESGKAVPVARVESEEIAAAISYSLGEFGVVTRTVSDEALAAENAPVRLRNLGFDEDELALELFNGPTIVRLKRHDIALIIIGIIRESRTEVMEKRKRGGSKTLSESETSADHPFIDIYSRHDPHGWRIPSSGFDFSSLGDEKSLLAAENLEKLRERLSAFAPTAKVVGDYMQLRPLLEHVWQSEHRRETLGLQRSGFGRKDHASVRSVSNLAQVNKYSRLQWHLL